MKWFTEVFLKSLDERFEGKNSIWLTEKQVAVCCRYMKESRYFSFLYIVVGDWQYSLEIMKKGYGRMVREDRRTAFH